MADPVYRLRSREGARHLERYDIVQIRNGGWIEVWDVAIIDTAETDHYPVDIVLVTPRGDNHARIAFDVNEAVFFLRPDEEPN